MCANAKVEDSISADFKLLRRQAHVDGASIIVQHIQNRLVDQVSERRRSEYVDTIRAYGFNTQ